MKFLILAEGKQRFITRSGLGMQGTRLHMLEGVSQGSVSKILMPTQSYLNEIDKDYSRNVDAVRKEIWSAADDFRRLMDAKDTSYKSKELPELLDVYSRFHHLEYRGAKWSTSD